jgi:exodeoxyribonuclease V alpha subunit
MQTEELTGVVDRIIFHNNENGFIVFALQVNKAQQVIINGHVPTLHAGEHVTVQGTWFTHPKFGRQLNATHCTTSLPTSLVGIKKYLASGMIKGIGPVYADKLVNAFGAQVLEVIDQQPYRLHEVAGIGPKRVERIITAWQDQKEISHIMVFLQEKNISPAYATKIYKRYGRESLVVVRENPYRLADDIWGIGFKIADQIAQNMGIAPDSLKRISSGILYALSTFIGLGNLYAELDALKKKALELLELTVSDDVEHKLKIALHDLYNSNKIKLISHNERHFLTPSLHYFSEKGVANTIKQLLAYKSRTSFDINAIYQQLRTSTDAINLNEDQQRGIITSLQSKVTIITGGPGTGKTTLIKKMLSILEANHVRYKLAAPTGRAAKRITEGTGRHAATLHRLLEFDVSTMSFKHNEKHALSLDFLIIDEASMIDIFLAHAVVKALPLDAHLILIGDVNQLPSVGAGNFLNDLIESTIIPTIRLTTIFRQAQDSLIIVNAHRINNGEFPIMNVPHSKRDFIFIKEEDPQTVRDHLEDIYRNGLPKFGIPAAESIVLVPMNRGIVGTHALNHNLQQILNAHETPKQIMRAGTIFKVGDRVMQIRNNYDKLIFNGDIGTIEDINIEEQTIVVNFLDQLITYETNEMDELVLAYAVSIHKSQGSEYNAVIVPLFMQHFMLLQRNLIYTAITRAKKLCIFLGQSKAIAVALRNTKGLERTTFLRHYVTSDLQCR